MRRATPLAKNRACLRFNSTRVSRLPPGPHITPGRWRARIVAMHPARIKAQTCGVLGRVRFWRLVKKAIPPCPRLRSDWNESPCASKSIALKYIGGSDSKCMLLCQRMAVVAASYCTMAIGRVPSWNVSLFRVRCTAPVVRAPSISWVGHLERGWVFWMRIACFCLVFSVCLLTILRKEARQMVAEVWITNVDVRAVDSSCQ